MSELLTREMALEQATLKAAREFIDDACAYYPHGDGPLITFSSAERIRVLTALILRQRAEAVEQYKRREFLRPDEVYLLRMREEAVESARPEIERKARIEALEWACQQRGMAMSVLSQIEPAPLLAEAARLRKEAE